MDMADWYEAQIDRLGEAVERVRELHKETHCGCCPSEETICSFCDHDYPCPTIKALDGEQ